MGLLHHIRASRAFKALSDADHAALLQWHRNGVTQHSSCRLVQSLLQGWLGFADLPPTVPLLGSLKSRGYPVL